MVESSREIENQKKRTNEYDPIKKTLEKENHYKITIQCQRKCKEYN